MSTADVQVYSFRLVQSFDVDLGRIPDDTRTIHAPFKNASIAALGIAVGYALVRTWDIPFDKLVFTIVPSNLVLLPPLCQLAFGRAIELKWLLIAMSAYWAFAICGFLQPALSFELTLSAALAPAIVAGIAVAFGKKQGRV